MKDIATKPTHDYSDNLEELAWLFNQAVNRGYNNLNELLAKNPGFYIYLAILWRRYNPYKLNDGDTK